MASWYTYEEKDPWIAQCLNCMADVIKASGVPIQIQRLVLALFFILPPCYYFVILFYVFVTLLLTCSTSLSLFCDLVQCSESPFG